MAFAGPCRIDVGLLAVAGPCCVDFSAVAVAGPCRVDVGLLAVAGACSMVLATWLFALLSRSHVVELDACGGLYRT